MYYEHIPERVITVNGTTIVWDVLVVTDRTILANRPGKLLYDKREKTCLLIEIVIPDDSNGNNKETEKLNKYKDLEIAFNRVWKARAKIVPFIIGALGTVKKGLAQNLQLLPAHRSATELQKVTLKSTAQSFRLVLG